MRTLKFAVFGAGFWSRFQLAAWRELPGARCVAIYNRTLAKAEALAQEFAIPHAYSDPEQLLAQEKLDFIDIITGVDTHPPLVFLAAKHRLPVICQKPMAPSLKLAREMVRRCREARVPFFVHENWRWQHPIRELKRVLDSGLIGRVFRARIDMASGFPVFKNQPALAELNQFILTDLGTHLLDVARFLFGEAESLLCHTDRAHKEIEGEDVATVLLRMQSATTVTVNMAYAGNFLERDRFPETFFFIEGTKGSVELAPDFWLRVTTRSGTHARRVPPPVYPWADPAYGVVQSSIVPCNRNLLRALQGKAEAETTAEDNLKTLELVYGAYDSARREKSIEI